MPIVINNNNVGESVRPRSFQNVYNNLTHMGGDITIDERQDEDGVPRYIICLGLSI